MKWDDLCYRCGLCCHEKVVLPGFLVVDPDSTCEFFDKDTHLCTVYQTRFKTCKRCNRVNIFTSMFSSWLPESCAYVKWARIHHIRLSKHRQTVLSNLDE